MQAAAALRMSEFFALAFIRSPEKAIEQVKCRFSAVLNCCLNFETHTRKADVKERLHWETKPKDCE
ncbi:hypothetical protein AVEN_41371-1 [Araneus ventricosus]|uniref:Uncharacterized protein n=1 Tax=Araneus ventricosus TaxID=182803 RepID=A0A4Y2PPR3_ARAVE|nr:hypothetical protein AVEN_41371-1 [Araneus ventricosus]